MREMASSIEGDKTPFTKPATPNRNDLCPCGSGKNLKMLFELTEAVYEFTSRPIAQSGFGG